MQFDRRTGRSLILKLVLTGTLVAGASVSLGSGTAFATKAEPHCVVQTSAGPLDLNALYGVSVRIVIPDCSQIKSGERWTVGLPWLMNPTFANAAPGFVPAGPTPLDDFMAKFLAVKYIVDAGTTEERTYVFPNDGKLFVGAIFGLPLVNTLTLGTLRPLSVGQHVVDAYWSFSAMHCDGFFATIIGDSVYDGGSCIPAGEHYVATVPFTVTADEP